MLTRRMSRVFPETSLMPQMSELMDAVLGAAPGVQAVFPPLNVTEDEHAFHVEAELPGFAMQDIDISLLNGELTISGKKTEQEQKEVNYHRRERLSSTEFKRVLRLATPIDADKIEASLERGVLTVILPKAEEAKPRRIQIKHG